MASFSNCMNASELVGHQDINSERRDFFKEVDADQLQPKEARLVA